MRAVVLALGLVAILAAPALAAEDSSRYAVRDPELRSPDLFQVEIRWTSPAVSPDSLRVYGLTEKGERLLASVNASTTRVVVPGGYEAYRIDSLSNSMVRTGVTVPHNCFNIMPTKPAWSINLDCLKTKVSARDLPFVPQLLDSLLA